MTDPRWDRLEVLLEEAARLSGERRAEFVERETTGDPALAAELDALLEASDGAGDYLGRLRQELLGSGMHGMLREAAASGEGPDPWIGRTVSHYEIVDRIGGGGMGVIYRARDARLDRTVALKFIAPEIRREPRAQQLFLQEARAASALDHPNICTIHEIGETEDGRQFIVMPAYDGETLRARLDRPPIGETEALDISRQIARALAAAHERGIVHRDVKPDNVVITRDGVVKLLDFGLARTADHAMSGPGAVVGTVAYMSPEQVGGRQADARSDVWALGVILFEMLAGRRPFTGDTPRGVLDQIAGADPDWSALGSGVTPEVIAVARRALAKDPAERFGSGRELLEDLAAVPGAMRPPSRRRARAIGAVTGGLLVLAAALSLRPGRNEVRRAPSVPPGSVSHLLWVDDNPENNDGVIKEFELRGIQVTTVLSTAEAVQRYDPAVHKLVVSDMGRFEGADRAYVARAGLDLLAQLRARRADVQVVYCTSARAATTYRAEALAAGARGVVQDCLEVLRVMGF
jgi:eukaryotic-like serine/threonine-protein kinase